MTICIVIATLILMPWLLWVLIRYLALFATGLILGRAVLRHPLWALFGYLLLHRRRR
jgi:hypothetical protein